MSTSAFPEFVRNLPECDNPFPDQRGWLLVGEAGCLWFGEVDVETLAPEHSHCDQWGIVVRGKIELTIGGETNVYIAGDSYVIPEGTPHKAKVYPGFASVDFFTDPNRYRARPR